MNEDNLHSWVDPELEARLVALVLGEASDFEREELERLMEEQPELALFMKRMEAVSDLLHGKADDSEGGGTADDVEWKLPDEKRRELLAAIDDGEESTEEADPEPEITEPDGGAVVETIPPSKRQGGRKNLPWNRFGKIAAVLCVVGTLLWMSLPAFQSIRRLAPSESAKSAKSEDARHWAYNYEDAAGGEVNNGAVVEDLAWMSRTPDRPGDEPAGSEKSEEDGWTNDSTIQPEPVELAAAELLERDRFRRGTADAKMEGDSAKSSLNKLRDSFSSYAVATDAPASGPATSTDDLMALHNLETSNLIAGEVSVKDIEETVRPAEPVPMPAVEEYRSKVSNFSRRLTEAKTEESEPGLGQDSVSGRKPMFAAIADPAAADPVENDLKAVRDTRFAKTHIGRGGQNLDELERMPAGSPEAAEAPVDGGGLLGANQSGGDREAREENSRLKVDMLKTQPAAADQDGDGVTVLESGASIVSANGTVTAIGGEGRDGGRVTLSAQAQAYTAVEASGALSAERMVSGGVIQSVDKFAEQTEGENRQLVTKAPANSSAGSGGLGGGGAVQAGGNPVPAETPPAVARISVAQVAPVALPAAGEPVTQNQKINKSLSLLSELEADSSSKEDFGTVGELADLDAELSMPEIADKASADQARWGTQPAKAEGEAKAHGIVVLSDGRKSGENGQVPLLGDLPTTTRLFRADAEKHDTALEPPMPALSVQQPFGDFDNGSGTSVDGSLVNAPDEGNMNGLFGRDGVQKESKLGEVEQMQTSRDKKLRKMAVVDQAGTEYLVDALASDRQDQVKETREQLEELQVQLEDETRPALEASANESRTQSANSERGHGQVTPIQIEGNIKTKDTVIRRDFGMDFKSSDDGLEFKPVEKSELFDVTGLGQLTPGHGHEAPIDLNLSPAVVEFEGFINYGNRETGKSQQAAGRSQAERDDDERSDGKKKTHIAAKFIEVDERKNDELGFDWLLNEQPADGRANGRVVLGAPGGTIRNEGSITANTATGSDGEIHVDTTPGTFTAQNSDAVFETARGSATNEYLYESLGVERQERLADGWSDRGRVAGQVSNGNLQAAEQLASQVALKGIKDSLSPNVHAGNAKSGKPMAGGDIDRNLGRFEPAQHEWERNPGETRRFDYDAEGKNSDGPVAWTGSTTWFAGDIAADSREWKEGFGGTVDREFIYPTEYDRPEISNSRADINVNALGEFWDVGEPNGTVAFGAGGEFNVLDGNDVRRVGSHYGKTTVEGGAVTMKTPAEGTDDYVHLGFRDNGRSFAANKVAPPAGLEEKNAAAESFSTFSLHVSDVSFKLAQAALAKGEWPEADRIRIEEFVNAFDYGDPMPSQEDKVACNLEQAAHPFLQQRNLLRVAMKTAAAGRAGDTPLRLTLLLDNSGSMERADRQESVRRAIALLADQLQPIDQVTLISFARQPRLIADKVSGDKARQLVEVVGNMPADGGTNLEAALKLAFEKAMEQKADKAQNRIVLLTDGAANLGDADPESLSLMIDEMREAGIAFDAAGIGADGLNDETLEALTRKGDGRYYFLDRPEDADDGFARQIAGALRPAAKNVKVQVEFNPDRVGNYKLLGFEKHRLKKEDFRNDAVDAAEMAAEEAGVAVYQFEAKADGQGDIGFVSVRFRDMSSGQMVEKRWPIPYRPNAPRPDQSSDSLKIATAAALLGAKLKGGPLGETVDLDELAQLVSSLPEHCQSRERVQQLGQMIDQARQLAGK